MSASSTTSFSRVHQVLRPPSYLEIGVSAGETLRLARCDSIGVDPTLNITSNVIVSKPRCFFYQMSSDRFFEEVDPTGLLGRPIDLAFLDGMHLSEFLLRDFINIERHCKHNSVIVLHDCLPTDVYIAERVSNRERRVRFSTRPGWWTGDVWKVPLALRKYRPELKICAFDAAPTGLVCVTALNSDSTVLADSYSKIASEFQSFDLLDYGLEQLFAQLDVQSTRQIFGAEQIAQYFGL